MFPPQMSNLPHNLHEFEIILPRRVVFGWGQRRRAGALAASLGQRAILVCGSRTLARNGTLTELQDALATCGVTTLTLIQIHREPLVGDIDAAVQTAIAVGAQTTDLIVVIGGGAAIDLAKAVAALVTNRHGDTVQDYLEGVGRGLEITNAPLPVLALPTTAGTGSEATRNSVISNLNPPFKKSLRSVRMVPEVVLIDPELTVSNPPLVTTHSGLDAITQLIEAYITKKANSATQYLCLEGLRGVVPALREAVRSPGSRPARETMAKAAFLSGVALTNSGLGFAHGVAAALGVLCQVPHGLACAVLLPTALRVNRLVKEADLATVGRVMLDMSTPDDSQMTSALIDEIETLCRDLQVPSRLRDCGVTREQLPALATASRGNSMSGNPRDLSDAELLDALGNIW